MLLAVLVIAMVAALWQFSPSFQQAMRDLADGDVRATVVNSAQILDWDMSQFKVIERSLPIGDPPIVVSTDMDTGLREQITELFLEFDPDTLPADSHVDGFVPLNDADYANAEMLLDACGHRVHD